MRVFATLTEPDGSIYMYHIPEEISELRFLNSSRIVKTWNEEEDFPIIQGFSKDIDEQIIPTFITDGEEGSIIDIYIKDVVNIHLKYEIIMNAPEHEDLWKKPFDTIYSLKLLSKTVEW